ncbi:MAG TPA: molybdenum cofactor biosynthesis protein B [Methanoregulaceae archaeon]|nr:molybdenum cofactor biosynthesis protein B [Methanoregulaceae archaeon]HQJ88638.1 molybdenum cofactor biosynthesis protein B [Methanoregulaceae archaeon]
MDPTHREPVEVRAGVITVSSTRTEVTDRSGALIRERFEAAGHRVTYRAIVPDARLSIRRAVLAALESSNCVVLSGGTGLTHDDGTIEAVVPLYEKTIDGFGELFRSLSFAEIGRAAMLSRASAGIIAGAAVFCIPGSTGAARLALDELILPEIGHILTHANR